MLKEESLVHGDEGLSGGVVVGELDEGEGLRARLLDELALDDGADLAEEREDELLRHGGRQALHKPDPSPQSAWGSGGEGRGNMVRGRPGSSLENSEAYLDFWAAVGGWRDP